MGSTQQEPSTEYKKTDSRLPSPPTSPARPAVLPQIRHAGTPGRDEKSEWMTIKTPRQGRMKEGVLSFLVRYENRGAFVKKSKPSVQKRAYAPRVVKPATPKRNVTYNSEENTSDTGSSKNYLLGTRHQYATRSRKVVSDGSSSPSKAGEASRGSDDATPRTFHGISKKDFLHLCSVQLIHDSNSSELPDFAPPMNHLSKEQIEKQIKRTGFSLTQSLKDTTAAEEVDHNELPLVAAFKLTPLQYLDTKRRFFAEKARKTHLGTTFKKTDAQKACKIDVNKASKLYEVFDHCGLLKDKLFSNF